MATKIRVLIVDDSAMMRRMIKNILETDAEIEVVGTARDGEDALVKARESRPDVVTLDVNMPVMDGLTCLVHLLEEQPDIEVVMLSSLTQEGALTTFEALELGAFDFVGKPSGTVSANLYIVGKEIIAKVKAAAKHRRRNKRKAERPVRPSPSLLSGAVKRTAAGETSGVAPVVVVIGVSTGGPGTLMEILPKLPADLKAGVIVVQHMPPMFTASFAQRLDAYCRLPFSEARSGDRLFAGRGFVAPGGMHLVLRKSSATGEVLLRLTQSPADALFIPSVDVTMRSALEVYGRKMVGVLLTGMGSDGAEAMVAVRKAGGITIAEDESTAVVFGMPREAIERGGASVIAPAHKIAEEIVKAVKRVAME
ncbi:protein-glutamate methylesterase/protein-glutamine glutaminase [Sporolituus thermophilus]|uniref:Protein-glutamate methylesterase/protein-glutamine glutaminase n=1 Tax=Sporolituus thermophilus DSM 23256 TaxID=1123285 RepID=A0A1G7JTQ2_9FIRM|nr:chemotaxis response regulator protein-glutamate methylesterase [Sporolituus thermophilus]SDF28323.1 two-component system, chemotaxis family, response regulator CheB [Sporolituus thermophilus DSM 23256]